MLTPTNWFVCLQFLLQTIMKTSTRQVLLTAADWFTLAMHWKTTEERTGSLHTAVKRILSISIPVAENPQRNEKTALMKEDCCEHLTCLTKSVFYWAQKNAGHSTDNSAIKNPELLLQQGPTKWDRDLKWTPDTEHHLWLKVTEIIICVYCPALWSVEAC